MNAILLTAFIGIVLATLFVILFLYQVDSRRFSSDDRESLMPLQTEETLPANFTENRDGTDKTERS